MPDLPPTLHVPPARDDFDHWLKRHTVGLRRWVRLIQLGLRNRVPLSLRHRLRAWRLGFNSTTYVLYQLDRNDPSLYQRDLGFIDYKLGRPSRLAVNDKLGLSHLLRGLGARAPRPVAFMAGGQLVGLDPEVPGAPRPTLAATLARHPRLVFRRVDGGGGHGIFFVRAAGQEVEINGTRVSLHQAQEWLGELDEFLATEYIDQAAYAADLYPRTSNTMRLLVLWDYETLTPYVASATQRIGTAASGLIDNFHSGQGGLSAPIDLASGVLGAAITIEDGHRVRRYSHHPDTGAAIEGVVVPGWSGVLAEVLRVAAALPHFAFVGWDLLMADEGLYWIEGNSPCGIGVGQVHRPLLEDERNRRFFRNLAERGTDLG